jgi:hypothetical protein
LLAKAQVQVNISLLKLEVSIVRFICNCVQEADNFNQSEENDKLGVPVTFTNVHQADCILDLLLFLKSISYSNTSPI